MLLRKLKLQVFQLLYVTLCEHHRNAFGLQEVRSLDQPPLEPIHQEGSQQGQAPTKAIIAVYETTHAILLCLFDHLLHLLQPLQLRIEDLLTLVLLDLKLEVLDALRLEEVGRF